MTTVLGVDGCPKGWCGAFLTRSSSTFTIQAQHFDTAREVFDANADVTAIDIPIGLLDDRGRRQCDTAARRLLADARSSVFSAPSRTALQFVDMSGSERYRVMCDANERVTGKRLSQQSVHIARKIRDVDAVITPELQSRVFEVHPEVCFAALNGGRPVRPKKARVAGREARWAVSRRDLPLIKAPTMPPEIAGHCGWSDYIDALVCAFTAMHISDGTAVRMPDEAPIDERGLRMEIWMPPAYPATNDSK